MTKIFNFGLKIKGGGREGGTHEVLRPCHPPKFETCTKMQMRLVILHTSCWLLMQAHRVLSNITGKLVSQTNIMGTVSTLTTFQNFI